MAVFGSNKRELTLNAGFSKIFVRKISTIVTDPDKKNTEFKNPFYSNLLHSNKHIKK